MDSINRIIGRYKGALSGPLIVIIGAMHGNEPSGVLALQELFKRIESIKDTEHDFAFRGEIIGLIGNVQAYEAQKRYIEKDLNRSWHFHEVRRILDTPKDQLVNEDVEIFEIVSLFNKLVDPTEHEKMYVLDIHTTSSHGAVFSIASEFANSIEVGLDMCAPVILGLGNDLSGTSLHFFNEKYLKIPTTALGFESGHHDDVLSPHRALAAITNFLRSIKVIEPDVIKREHDILLTESTHHLPKRLKITYRHQVDNIDLWEMKKGYVNFQPIVKDELLAYYDGMEIKAPYDGRILMPLYQEQGQDGFFIVKEVF